MIDIFLRWLASKTTPAASYDLCHFLVGLVFVLVLGRLGSACGPLLHADWMFIYLLGLAALKEFWFDVYYEDAVLAGNGIIDFCGYAVGGIVGLILALKLP
jgi:hypothetical protein